MALSDTGMKRSIEDEASSCARQTFALLPSLRRFVTSRVQRAGSDADLHLSLRQFAALRGIQQGAASPGELARLWQVTPAVITGIVDRLESRGLVRREPEPADRRRLRLVLTESGRRASDEVEAALTGELAGQLATSSGSELAELGRSLALLQRTFSSLDERQPASAAPRGEDDFAVCDDEETSIGKQRPAVGWTGG